METNMQPVRPPYIFLLLVQVFPTNEKIHNIHVWSRRWCNKVIWASIDHGKLCMQNPSLVFIFAMVTPLVPYFCHQQHWNVSSHAILCRFWIHKTLRSSHGRGGEKRTTCEVIVPPLNMILYISFNIMGFSWACGFHSIRKTWFILT